MSIAPRSSYAEILSNPSVSRQKKLELLSQSRFRSFLNPWPTEHVIEAIGPSPELADLLDRWLKEDASSILPELTGHASALGPYWEQHHLASLTPYLINEKRDPIPELCARALVYYSRHSSQVPIHDTNRIIEDAIREASAHRDLVNLALREPWLAQQLAPDQVEHILIAAEGSTAWRLARALYLQGGALIQGQTPSLETGWLNDHVRRILRIHHLGRDLKAEDFNILLAVLGKNATRVFVEDRITDTDPANRSPAVRASIPQMMEWLTTPDTPLHVFGADWVRQQVLRLGHTLGSAKDLRLNEEMWKRHAGRAEAHPVPLPAVVLDNWVHSEDFGVRAMTVLNSWMANPVDQEEERLINERVSRADEVRWALPETRAPGEPGSHHPGLT